jgi:hypothetical protein
MNPDTKFDALLGRQSSIALDHAGLHINRTAHRVDDAAELNEDAVAGTLYNVAVMHCDCGINQVAPKGA